MITDHKVIPQLAVEQEDGSHTTVPWRSALTKAELFDCSVAMNLDSNVRWVLKVDFFPAVSQSIV